MSLQSIFGEEDVSLYKIQTHSKGADGSLPLTPEMLLDSPSGDLFGLSQNVGMGWAPSNLLGKQVLILGTQGGIRNHDGTPIALGYHTGHWEIGLLMKASAQEISRQGGVPFAGFVSDPCDGRSQGTTGMFDSLPFRNDAAIVYRRLIRSLPTRRAIIGVATCDKGLPAMMVALASMHDLPTIIVPGGVTLPPTNGEDAGKIQTIGARYANNEITLQEAADLGCRACATPGGGCQFLGTAGTSQVVAEAIGMALPHSALAPSGQSVWVEMAKQSARAALEMEKKKISTKDIITDKAIENAMVIHAAFGGSTNLLLHIPAIAHAANCKMPTVEDWTRINKKVPRLVDVLPNGPVGHTTVKVFLAGGVPEVMLHLRKLGVLHEDVLTVTGETLGSNLDWWEKSERRAMMKKQLLEADGINPDDIIMDPTKAKEKGLTSTVTFPKGNIAPEGSVIKSTSIDPSVVGEDGVYRHIGKAKVFTSEKAAIKSIKTGGIEAGDIMVVMGGGPSGTGMEETYQLTSALKHLSFGKHVSLLTDARFSGVSTGACIGHIGPEALAGGPIGKLRDGDIIEIIIDRNQLVGSVNFVGTENTRLSLEKATKVLQARDLHPELKPDPALPDDTRLWAALQSVSGGTWRGNIYDTDRIIEVLKAGVEALGTEKTLVQN
ncbi:MULTISPECIES: YjhG/YagF family D-xylonate dehydratase [Priestia]|uniref:YjhG/YagF family D-xylonate dehydratase n=1 Tax=Priestia TaxID=2800373 RepID=UPI001EC46BD5|nr:MULTISPECIES: YjhG/YagF family D-xylonate dehydratase [Priestia]MBY0091639.1 YjhG/YagF family D-xylonate dehydratase [Priestia aryabhattai]MBY0103521.1 YjhG/YagF family D-xylonate dehydratase [Priestia aryabhattai]MCM3308190.1 YjhG/YagF family D-xylonate dehydratase [Priestia megaterium]MED4264011.1 YjhG/YagF family D-xylonate dehydratase [Priestia megaterium]MED4276110.1 YjhG/YagF family D-xylonate dehydratase [Priestia megaterium]